MIKYLKIIYWTTTKHEIKQCVLCSQKTGPAQPRISFWTEGKILNDPVYIIDYFNDSYDFYQDLIQILKSKNPWYFVELFQKEMTSNFKGTEVVFSNDHTWTSMRRIHDSQTLLNLINNVGIVSFLILIFWQFPS